MSKFEIMKKSDKYWWKFDSLPNTGPNALHFTAQIFFIEILNQFLTMVEHLWL